MKAIACMITFGMAACVGQDLTTPEPRGTVEGETTADESSAENSELRSKTFTAEDVSLLDADPKDDAAPLAQDCVFIQFCDEPPAGGKWKVVGKVRSACRNQCFNDAILDEFVRDAKAVCGSTSLNDGKGRLDC